MSARNIYGSADILRCQAEWEASNKTERLGQWFYNRMDHTGEPFPELFLSEDKHLAKRLIWLHYYDQYGEHH